MEFRLYLPRELNKFLEAFAGGQGKGVDDVGEVLHLQVQKVVLQLDPRIQQFFLLLLHAGYVDRWIGS